MDIDLALGASKEPYNFYDEEIISAEPEKLNEYRKERRFTNIILVNLDGTKFHVHKVIISARCPYFEGLFNSDFTESAQAEIQLDRNISANNFESIITYIYTGRINITTENALIINENANYFGLKKLKEASEKVLMKKIDLENILFLWRYANKFSNMKLQALCLDFILQNSGEFFKKYILNLEYDELLTLVSNYDFDQNQLWFYIIEWIKNDFENREKYILDLLSNIDFLILSDDLKNTIKADALLLSSANFNKLTLEIALSTNSHKESKRKKENAMIRNGTILSDLDELIFLINTSISVLNLRKTRPRLVPILGKISFDRTRKSIYKESDNIFFCGLAPGKSCQNFSYRTNTFKDLSPMLETRQGFGITKVNEKIYACGGQRNKGSIEIYDINTDKWSYGKSMSKQQLYDFGIVNYNQSIYTFGGKTKKPLNYEYVATESTVIQRYDPRENVWEIVMSQAIEMTNLLQAFTINESTVRCFFNESLVYGCDINSCDYDVRNNTIRILPLALTGVKGCILCKSKNYVYVLSQGYWRGNKIQPAFFGYLDITSTPSKFIEYPGFDLSSFHGGVTTVVNAGPDQYNFLNSILEAN